MRFRKLGSNRRLVIVGGAAALAVAVWLGWPYIKGAVGGTGHHLRRVVQQMVDDPSCQSPRYDDGPRRHRWPRGEGDYGEARGGDPWSRYDDAPRRRRRPRGEGDYSEAPGQDPLSRGEGDYAEPLKRGLWLPPSAGGAGLGRSGNVDGVDRLDRPHRWRDCTNSPGHVRHCGPWQTGPAPEGE